MIHNTIMVWEGPSDGRVEMAFLLFGLCLLLALWFGCRLMAQLGKGWRR